MSRLLALVLLCSTLIGCELIADFDRSKIPQEEPSGPDGGFDLDAGPGPGPGDEEDAGEEADEDAG